MLCSPQDDGATVVQTMKVQIASVGLLAFAVSACGGGTSGGEAAPSPSPSTTQSSPSTTQSPAQLSVSSSLTNGETLTEATTWQAKADGAPIDHVDFFIDGKKLWTELNAPYFFNDDHQYLEPWLLSPGKHVLLTRATGTEGETGESTTNVKVGPAPSVPPGLTGSFTRTVTQGDIDRTAKEPGREVSATLPAGHWTMQLDSGMLTFDDPLGSGGGEAFSATPGQLKMWGWPQWRLPRDRRGEFCEGERPVTYTWSSSADTLVIAGGGDCADRDALFVGTWHKVS